MDFICILQVDISLWGYREDSITPELIYIDQLESSVANIGKVMVKYTFYMCEGGACYWSEICLCLDTSIVWIDKLYNVQCSKQCNSAIATRFDCSTFCFASLDLNFLFFFTRYRFQELFFLMLP